MIPATGLSNPSGFYFQAPLRALVKSNGAYPRFAAQIVDGSQILDDLRCPQQDENLKLARIIDPVGNCDAAPAPPTIQA